MLTQNPIGKLPIQVSRFGMGTMRLPQAQEDGRSVVDVAETTRMIRAAIEQGVNYFDTAYGYHGGRSEKAVGEALKDGWREKTNIATKLPRWQIKTPEDMPRIFNEQLTRLQTTWVDFYLLHAIDGPSYDKLKALGVLEFLDGLKRSGQIRFAGFSYHGNADDFIRIINDYDWDFVQVQYNYMDINNQAGMAGVKAAAAKGLAVMVMEPLLGGRLVNVPDEIAKLFADADPAFAPYQWAFRWLADQPEVSVILSGTSTMQQLQSNIDLFSTLSPGCMTDADKAVIDQAREIYTKRQAVPCTGCRYCMPCPSGVNIPGLFSLWNDVYKYGDDGMTRGDYGEMVDEGCGPDKCVACGKCLTVCPQGFPIIEQLAALQKYMSK